jgi:hypothetical protein
MVVQVDAMAEVEIMIAVAVKMSVLWKLTMMGEEMNWIKLDKDVEMESVVHSIVAVLVLELIIIDYLGRWHRLPGLYTDCLMVIVWIRFNVCMNCWSIIVFLD